MSSPPAVDGSWPTTGAWSEWPSVWSVGPGTRARESWWECGSSRPIADSESPDSCSKGQGVGGFRRSDRLESRCSGGQPACAGGVPPHGPASFGGDDDRSGSANQVDHRDGVRPRSSVADREDCRVRSDPAATVALMSNPRVPGGVVHKLPVDLRKALVANPTALIAWKDITPLARNEFICWVEDAKQEMTRERRIRRTQEELEEGQRRPCCWPGCAHRVRNGK